MGSGSRRRLVYLAPTFAELTGKDSGKSQAIGRRSSRLGRSLAEDGGCLHERNLIEEANKRQKKIGRGKSDKASSPIASRSVPSQGGNDVLLSVTEVKNGAAPTMKIVSKSSTESQRKPLKLLSTSSGCQSENLSSMKIASDSGSKAGSAPSAEQSDQYPDQEEEFKDKSRSDTSTKIQERLPIRPTSKAEYLRLGPARVVGLRRRHNQKSYVFPAPMVVTPFKSHKVKEQRPGPKPLTESSAIAAKDRSIPEESIGGTTTIDSIPPPPTHLFTLSSITSIYSLLSSPNDFISSHQGGSQHEISKRFNLLGLIIRVEGVESCPNWKAGIGKMMDRCEMIVKDASECTIKVVLEGDCATRWASTKSSQSFQLDQESSEYSHETNPFEESISAFNDISNLANGSELEVQRLNKLFPLRPGDVIVLSRLVLTRPQHKRKKDLHFEKESKGPASVFATASPRWEPHIELCWRNDVRTSADQRRNFDQSLTAFDARCRAIYRLAKLWSA